MRQAYVAAGWAWAAAIVWLSLAPVPPQVDFSHSDKVGHVAAYGLLMLWFSFLYPTARVFYAAAFVAMGAGLEFAQGALGYRSFEVLDMVGNGAGVVLGWGAAFVVSRMRAA